MKRLVLGALMLSGVAFAVLMAVMIFEGMSHTDKYVIEECVVQSVEDNPTMGYIAEDFVTYVKFTSDGYVIDRPGKLGKPGDTIAAKRVAYTESLLGWLGDSAFIK